MLEEQIYKGHEVISKGDICESIIFVIDGTIIIEIEDEDGDMIEIDQL